MTLSPPISREIFTHRFESFRRLVAEDPDSEGPFVDFRSGLLARNEGYKENVYREGKRRLAVETWSESDVGSGRILDRVIDAIEIQGDEDHRNNLVHWQPRQGDLYRSHRKLREAREDSIAREGLERTLYNLYTGAIPKSEAFEALVKQIGQRYDVLAYLFFLLDDRRFMPIGVSAFERAFEILGIPLKLSHKASWENYQAYLARLDAVHKQLVRVGVPDVRLLDAHSFCWFLGRELEEPATARELSKQLSKLDFEHDAREFPDEHRRGRFRAGWRNAASGTYSDETLKRLTWENLGYRFGKVLGNLPVAEMDRIFDLASRVYREERPGETTKTISAESLHPETLPETANYYEGHTQTVRINRYERNTKARAACILIHGHCCAVCDIDFAERYGEIGEGFIHVHHRYPLALRREGYEVDPQKDLIPVCPNCHAMLHKWEPPMDIDELKARLRG